MFRGFVFSEGESELVNSAEQALRRLKKGKHVVWVDFEDPTEDEIDFLSEKFNFHPLSIEDSIIPQDHPKLEEFDDYVFMIIYALKIKEMELFSDQLNIFFGKKFIVTVHDSKINAVERVANRAKSKLKNKFFRGPDILVHNIMDNVVDEYFPVIDKIEEQLDEFEDSILSEKTEGVIDEIIKQKKNVLALRKMLALEKPVVNRLMRAEVDYISENQRVYFQDTFDHISQLTGTVENLRDLVPSLMDAYNSMMNKRTNDAIHRLTVVATIAMPVVAITSYYGQNLALPEVKWGMWGVVFMWALIILSSFITYLVLKWKKWL